MSKPHYPYNQLYASRYTFMSIGKKQINKAVDFSHTGIRRIVSLGCIILEDGEYTELPFEPKADLKFMGFIIRRIA